MNIAQPTALLWLLPILGWIVLLYILKLRRKDVVVSSTLLWRQVIRDVQANAPFQKLRRSLLFYLQILAAALLVFALAKPFFRARGLGGRSIVVILDRSASMAATDVSGSRLEEAKRIARKVVNDMKPEDQVMLLATDYRPEPLTGFTADRTELMRAIELVKIRATTTNMRDALNLAAALVGGRETGQIDIITDGGFAAASGVNIAPRTSVRYHSVGKSSNNLGIVALDYRRSLSGEPIIQVFVTVHNFDSLKHTTNVVIKQGDRILDAREVNLAPGGEDSDTFEIPEPTSTVSLEVEIDSKDDLATDNRASLVVVPRKKIKALLVTAENVFLENSLRVDPNLTLSVGKPGSSTAGFDVVVFDSAAPSELPEGNYFFVGCTSNQAPVKVLGRAENQGLIDPNKTHPVLQYVDFGTTRWTDIAYARPLPWGQELAGSEAGAGIVAGEKGKSRSLWIGFQLDLSHGPFPLTVAYPIFVSNAMRWLARADDNGLVQIRTGTPVTIDAPSTVGTITVKKPDGTTRSMNVPSRGGVVFDETDLVGTYDVSGSGGFHRVYAANLVDADESSITPRKHTDVEGATQTSTGRPVTVTHELWPWIASILVGLLCFEWWAFHRRVFATS